MAFFLKDLEIFKARGGHVILVRCPSSGSLRAAENMGVPRAGFWDDLVKESHLKAYHFEGKKYISFTARAEHCQITLF